MQIFSGAVFFDILAHLYDFAGSFMAKSHGNQAERVSLKFVCVRSADAAPLYFYQNVVVANLGHGKFFHFKFLKSRQHCHMSRFRNASSRTALALCWSGRAASRHLIQNLLDNQFKLFLIYCHYHSPTISSATALPIHLCPGFRCFLVI